jgi:hypothetical protein
MELEQKGGPPGPSLDIPTRPPPSQGEELVHGDRVYFGLGRSGAAFLSAMGMELQKKGGQPGPSLRILRIVLLCPIGKCIIFKRSE